jgi:hypothetical protein
VFQKNRGRKLKHLLPLALKDRQCDTRRRRKKLRITDLWKMHLQKAVTK